MLKDMEHSKKSLEEELQKTSEVNSLTYAADSPTDAASSTSSRCVVLPRKPV